MVTLKKRVPNTDSLFSFAEITGRIMKPTKGDLMSIVKFPPYIDPGLKTKPRYWFLWTFGFVGVIIGTVERWVLGPKG